MNDLSGEGMRKYEVRHGDFLEAMVTYVMANSKMMSVVLRKQLELEQRLNGGEVDHDKVDADLLDICNSCADQATQLKNETILKLYLKNND